MQHGFEWSNGEFLNYMNKNCLSCRHRARPCGGPGECACRLDKQKRHILIVSALPLPDLPAGCPILTAPVEINMPLEEAVAQSKLGGCCNGGKNPG